MFKFVYMTERKKYWIPFPGHTSMKFNNVLFAQSCF